MGFSHRYNPSTGLIDVVTPNADVTLRGSSSDITFTINGNGYYTGNLGIAGKLTVDGLIDPTGLVLSEQASSPYDTTANGTEGVVWVRDDGYLVFTNQSGTDQILGESSGPVATPTLAEVLEAGNVTGLTSIELSNSLPITNDIATNSLNIEGKDSASNTGFIQLITGDSTGGNSGGINVITGEGGSGNSGNFDVSLGDATAIGGSFYVNAGNSSGDAGGAIQLYSGDGSTRTGDILLYVGGNAGNFSSTDSGGNIRLRGSSGVFSAGLIDIRGGDSDTGSSGYITLAGGNADTSVGGGIGGFINLTAGSGYSQAGYIGLYAGSTSSTTESETGFIYIKAGDANDSGLGGTVTVEAGGSFTGTGTPGDIIINSGDLVGEDTGKGEILLSRGKWNDPFDGQASTRYDSVVMKFSDAETYIAHTYADNQSPRTLAYWSASASSIYSHNGASVLTYFDANSTTLYNYNGNNLLRSDTSVMELRSHTGNQTVLFEGFDSVSLRNPNTGSEAIRIDDSTGITSISSANGTWGVRFDASNGFGAAAEGAVLQKGSGNLAVWGDITSLATPTVAEDGYIAIASGEDLAYIGGVENGDILMWNGAGDTWEAITPDGYAPIHEALTVGINGQTAFTLSREVTETTLALLFIGGLKQEMGDYTVSGTTLTWTGSQTLLTTDVIEVFYFEGSGIGFGGAGGASSVPNDLLVLGAIQLVQETGYEVISGFEFDPADYNNPATMIFRVLLETSSAADGAEVRLYNITTSTEVASSVLSTTSTSTVLLTADITSDISSGSNIYELQMRLQTTGSPNTATCKRAEIRFS